ncbi:MAG: hypothetical protein CMF22_11275 [Idiomarinaceae bacterium]|nr:hypothetical protein [Idiomarinaceae bacterium]|tara:strand:+ start:130930 stop:131589 length:660 start_codon:yes stop_codon:yes gene_type:complete
MSNTNNAQTQIDERTNQEAPVPYVTQRELFDELIKSRIDGKMSNELCEMFRKISVKYSKHRKFSRYYHLADEFEGIGLLACCKGFPKFRPHQDADIEWDEKTPVEYDWTVCSNPFAFFTTCIHNDFIQFLKREYKQSNIVNEMRLTQGLEASAGYTDMKMEEAKREREEMNEEATELEQLERGTENQSVESDIRTEGVWDGYESLRGVTDTSLIERDKS